MLDVSPLHAQRVEAEYRERTSGPMRAVERARAPIRKVTDQWLDLAESFARRDIDRIDLAQGALRVTDIMQSSGASAIDFTPAPSRKLRESVRELGAILGSILSLPAEERTLAETQIRTPSSSQQLLQTTVRFNAALTIACTELFSAAKAENSAARPGLIEAVQIQQSLSAAPDSGPAG